MAVSALLVVGGGVALAIGSLASRRERLVSYPVIGVLNGLAFDVGNGDVVIVGSREGVGVTVVRTERFSFGHDAVTRRVVVGGALHVRSRCPSSLLGTCSVAYRVVVPDNVPLDVRTEGGDVTLSGYRGSARLNTRGGRISVSGYCGNSLDARTGGGDIVAVATCAPPRLSLRAGSGSVRAVVPAGRYEVDAGSSSGATRVRGVTAAADAPYSVQALSGSGDVSVEGRS